MTEVSRLVGFSSLGSFSARFTKLVGVPPSVYRDEATFDELSSRGVTFLQEPAERPYGIEAVFRDDSGNWFSLTQRTPG